MIKKITNFILCSFFVIFLFGTAFVLKASAASFYFSPETGIYSVGDVISADIMLDSGGEPVNAAEGILNFNKEELEVVKITKDSSIFRLWTQEPDFSNLNGVISFAGGTTENFEGSGGNVFSISFRVKSSSESSLVNFSSAAILAADGKGSNIITTMRSAAYTLVPKISAPKADSAVLSQGVPVFAQISSDTHPDQDRWYSDNNPHFSWPVLPDILTTRMGFDAVSDSLPGVLYNEALFEKNIGSVDNGIWYFHIQQKNKNGWGQVSTFKVNVDNGRPTDLFIEIYQRYNITDPKPKFFFNVSDAISQINYFEVFIDNNKVHAWYPVAPPYIYEAPVLTPGDHIIIAKAYDGAGNFTANSFNFKIEPISAPRIVYSSSGLQPGEILTVLGSTEYKDSPVTIWLQKDKGEPVAFSVLSDVAGNFTFVSDDSLQEGVYTLWAEITDSRGAKSSPSEKIKIAVQQALIIKWGNKAVLVMSVILSFISLLIVLFFVLWHTARRFKDLIRKIRKETLEAEESVQKEFSILKNDVLEQIKILESARNKRELTIAEKIAINKLKKHLDIAHDNIDKEIKDIDDETKDVKNGK